MYVLGHTALPEGGLEMAALLAFGPDAWLSHLSAAELWRLRPRPEEIVELTTVRTGFRARPGLRFRRVRRLDPRDVTVRAGLAVTTPSRTLLDVAETMTLRDLERTLEQAEVLRLVTRPGLAKLIARSPGRRGVAPLRVLLARDGRTVTQSALEERFLRLVRAANFPQPEVNVRVAGWEADFLWRRQRLIVETDGYRYHAHRAAFERDRRRDLDLQATGYRVVRVTHRQLEEEAMALTANLAVLDRADAADRADLTGCSPGSDTAASTD